MSTAYLHSCGVTTAGAAYCWGDGDFGQNGNGDTTAAPAPTPVPVAGRLTFAAVSAGGGHSCGVTTTGVAYCWGVNPVGQLGAGTSTGPEQCTSSGLNAVSYACSTVPIAVAGGLIFKTVIAADGTLTPLPTAPKDDLADAVLDLVAARFTG